MVRTDTANRCVMLATPDASCQVATFGIRAREQVPKVNQLWIINELREICLLQETTALGSLSMGSFVENAEISIGGGGWDSGSKDDNVAEKWSANATRPITRHRKAYRGSKQVLTNLWSST